MDFFQNQQLKKPISYLNCAGNDSSNLEVFGFFGYANYMNDNIKVSEKYYQRVFDIDSNKYLHVNIGILRAG